MIKPKYILKIILILGLGLIIQLAYYAHVITERNQGISNPTLVLVFSGGESRVPFAIHWSQQHSVPYWLASGLTWNALHHKFQQNGKPGHAIIILEPHAKTTDENARFSVALIKTLPIRSIDLVTSWYHLPRALLLLHYYLWRSNIHVYGLESDSPPRNFFKTGIFWLEMLKLWGSFGRVILSYWGIEKH